MEMDKIVDMVQSLINGNISDAREDLKRISKTDLIDFMRIYKLSTGKEYKEVFRKIKGLLN